MGSLQDGLRTGTIMSVSVTKIYIFRAEVGRWWVLISSLGDRLPLWMVLSRVFNWPGMARLNVSLLNLTLVNLERQALAGLDRSTKGTIPSGNLTGQSIQFASRLRLGIEAHCPFQSSFLCCPFGVGL